MRNGVVLVAAVLALTVEHAISLKVSEKKSLVFGSALNPNVATPARYLYVRARTASGKNFTTSPGPNTFDVSITVESGGRVQQIKNDWRDLGDGLFQGIFFFGQQPHKLTINVKHDGKHVAKSPYELYTPEIERCNCPHSSENFVRHYQCNNADFVQVNRDLEPFPKVSREKVMKLLNTILENNSKNGGQTCLVHYAIVNNQVWGKAYGPWQGYKKFSDEFFTSLVRKVRIPDIEFILNLGDWPVANATMNTLDVPVIAWCGSEESSDFVLPTYKVLLGSVFGKDVENMQAMDGWAGRAPAWKDRVPKAYWRGRDSHPMRMKLVFELAQQRPDLFDTKLSRNPFNYYPSEEDRRKDIDSGLYAKKVDRVEMGHYFKYKYLINIDGTVAAYRMPALLAGNSVVFLQNSSYYEHFYKELIPWVHYVPVKHDLSDLVEKLEWAVAHDREAQQIGENGRQFARDRLKVTDTYCYYYRLLSEYAYRQDWDPKRVDGMELADHDKQAGCQCLENAGPEPRKRVFGTGTPIVQGGGKAASEPSCSGSGDDEVCELPADWY